MFVAVPFTQRQGQCLKKDDMTIITGTVVRVGVLNVDALAEIKKKIVKELKEQAESEKNSIDAVSEAECNEMIDGNNGKKFSHVCLLENGDISGFLLCNTKIDSENKDVKGNNAFIHKFVVLKAFREKGVGKRLLQATGKVAEEERIEALFLTVYKTNRLAIQYYLNRGLNYFSKKYDDINGYDSYLLYGNIQKVLQGSLV